MGLRQAERGGASHGQPGEMGLRDTESIHQRNRIGNQQPEGVAAGRRLAAAVPALVISQHPERPSELARLLRPTSQGWSRANC